MKAKTIKKLRNKISKFKVYKIKESSILHGGFSWMNIYSFVQITSNTPLNAVRRYMKRYYRVHGIRNVNHDVYMETAENWGRVMVVDVDANITYYYN